jgi:hypothetical protein
VLRSARRAKSASLVASIAAVALGGSAAWAVWALSGSGNGSATAGSVIDLRADGHPDPNAPLYPGARSDLFVTIHNDNKFPVIVNRIQPGASGISADSAHRAAGCVNTGVSLSSPFYSVSVGIPARSTSTVLLPRAILMNNTSDSPCQGATFTVPLTLIGKSNVK